MLYSAASRSAVLITYSSRLLYLLHNHHKKGIFLVAYFFIFFFLSNRQEESQCPEKYVAREDENELKVTNCVKGEDSRTHVPQGGLTFQKCVNEWESTLILMSGWVFLDIYWTRPFTLVNFFFYPLSLWGFLFEDFCVACYVLHFWRRNWKLSVSHFFLLSDGKVCDEGKEIVEIGQIVTTMYVRKWNLKKFCSHAIYLSMPGAKMLWFWHAIHLLFGGF